MEDISMAYITVVDSISLVPAARVLGESLKDSNSKCPLIVAVTEDIVDRVRDDIQELGLIVESIPKIRIEKCECSDSLLPQSILGIFNLDNYEKLIYLDCRTLILKNIDEFFKFPDKSIFDFENPDDRHYNAFVFEPKYHNAAVYRCLLENSELSIKEMFDILWTSPLAEPHHRLPSQNFRIYRSDKEKITEDDDFSILLFDGSDVKPWSLTTSEGADSYVMEYLNILSRMYPISNSFKTNYSNSFWKSAFDF